MNKQEKKNKKFPKEFFSNLKPCNLKSGKKPLEKDKPFEWSENVLNGKTKVKIVSLNKPAN